MTTADQALDADAEPGINIGVTYQGLIAVGVGTAILDRFDAVFQEGPDAGALGDVEPGSTPQSWWEMQFRTEDVHCLVNLHSRTDEGLDPVSSSVRA